MKNVHDVIVKPIITERSMSDMADKKYTFQVDKSANKLEIKEAVEKIFGVEVEKVTTANVRGKFKRVGVHVGKTASYKKAIVKLTEKSKGIEFFESLQ